VVYESGNLNRVKEIAKTADAVVVVAGLTFRDEGEGGGQKLNIGGDRETLALSKKHQELIRAAAEASERCIVVLEGGGAITMEGWQDKVEAILMAWYPGMEGGAALAQVLFGEVNPCGKLPVVFPRSEDQCVPFDNESETVEYGYYHGYRHLDKQGLEPLYPFGFGLSYTEYQYGNLRIDQKEIAKSGQLEAKVDVTNTGQRAGEEIAQLYVGYPGSKIDRPVKELKGFGKLALKPGETGTVSFQVQARDLAYFDAASNSWQVESIEYQVLVGPSSCPKRLLTESFKISG
jgi:beta-glucosidase